MSPMKGFECSEKKGAASRVKMVQCLFTTDDVPYGELTFALARAIILQ